MDVSTNLPDLISQLTGVAASGDITMASILLTAILSAFLVVRVLVGPWARNPVHLVVAMVGAVVAGLLVVGIPLPIFEDAVTQRVTIFIGAVVFTLGFDRAMKRSAT